MAHVYQSACNMPPRRVHRKGTALVRDVADKAAQEQEEFLKPLGREDRAQLNRLLRRLYEAHVEEGG